MKKHLCLLAVLMICLLLGGCKTKQPISNSTMPVSEDAMVQEAFYLDNQLYTIRADGKKLFLVSEASIVSGQETVGISLVEMRADGDGTAKWWPSQEKILITKGAAVFLYDISGNTAEVIWEMAEAKKSNCVNVPCIGEDWLIIQENYGIKNIGVDNAYVPYVYLTKEYSAFNVATGEVKALFRIQNNELALTEGNSTLIRINEEASIGNGTYINGPEMICLEEENLYFLMGKNDPAKPAEEISALRLDLKDMSITELGTYEGSLPFNARGFVYEETLYFSENTYGIYSVPAKGGKVSFALPDKRYYLISEMKRKDDELYLVLLNGTTSPDSLICRWNPETAETHVLTEALSGSYSVFWTGESFCTYYISRGALCSEYKCLSE